MRKRFEREKNSSPDGFELTTSRMVAEHATTTPRQPDGFFDKNILSRIASNLVIKTPALCYPLCAKLSLT